MLEALGFGLIEIGVELTKLGATDERPYRAYPISVRLAATAL